MARGGREGKMNKGLLEGVKKERHREGKTTWWLGKGEHAGHGSMSRRESLQKLTA